MADQATATKPANPAQTAKAEVRGGLTPYLMLDGAIKAGEFYKRAFGAEIAASVPPDDKGRTMHLHLYVNGTRLPVQGASGLLVDAPAGGWRHRAMVEARG